MLRQVPLLASLIAALTLTASLCAPASASMAPLGSMKFAQSPDTTVQGVDVAATTPVLVADDWLCNRTEPITDIRIWASWSGDNVDPTMTLLLGIRANQPALGGQSPSQPGDLLWSSQVAPTQYAVEQYFQFPEGSGEWFYDPVTGLATPAADQTIWQYSIHFNPQDAFVQQGTIDLPVTYWLTVSAGESDAPLRFGWKTSIDHHGSPAVWTDDGSIYHGLSYPPGHPQAGEAMDMSFVFIPEPASLSLLAAGVLGLLRRR